MITPPNIAWDVEVNGLPGVLFAPTRSKAKWKAVKAYWEAYDRRRGVWPQVSATCAHRHDNSALKDKPRPSVFGEEDFYPTK